MIYGTESGRAKPGAICNPVINDKVLWVRWWWWCWLSVILPLNSRVFRHMRWLMMSIMQLTIISCPTKTLDCLSLIVQFAKNETSWLTRMSSEKPNNHSTLSDTKFLAQLFRHNIARSCYVGGRAHVERQTSEKSEIKTPDKKNVFMSTKVKFNKFRCINHTKAVQHQRKHCERSPPWESNDNDSIQVDSYEVDESWLETGIYYKRLLRDKSRLLWAVSERFTAVF